MIVIVLIAIFLSYYLFSHLNSEAEFFKLKVAKHPVLKKEMTISAWLLLILSILTFICMAFNNPLLEIAALIILILSATICEMVLMSYVMKNIGN